jgi:hypothetical protein
MRNILRRCDEHDCGSLRPIARSGVHTRAPNGRDDVRAAATHWSNVVDAMTNLVA